MSYKSKYIDRSRRDEWCMKTRTKFQVHGNRSDEYFDQMPKVEGLGKQTRDRHYINRKFSKWLRAYIGQPWDHVQAEIKKAIPDKRDYISAIAEVHRIAIIDGIEYIINGYSANILTPVSDPSTYGPTFYVDKNGILREAVKPKKVKYVKPIQYLNIGGHIWYRRRGIYYHFDRTKAYTPLAYRSFNPNGLYRSYMNTCRHQYGSIYFIENGKEYSCDGKNIKQANKKEISLHIDKLNTITKDAKEL